MLYLKFTQHDTDRALLHRVVQSEGYTVSWREDGVKVVYYDREMALHEEVGEGHWLNCFVMNDRGQTVDKIEA